MKVPVSLLNGPCATWPRDRSGTERAIGHYFASLKNNPSDSQVWLAIASAYRDIGNMKDADYALTKALYYDREVPNVIWESGLFYLSENRQKEALQVFRRFISIVRSNRKMSTPSAT